MLLDQERPLEHNEEILDTLRQSDEVSYHLARFSENRDKYTLLGKSILEGKKEVRRLGCFDTNIGRVSVAMKGDPRMSVMTTLSSLSLYEILAHGFPMGFFGYANYGDSSWLVVPDYTENGNVKLHERNFADYPFPRVENRQELEREYQRYFNRLMGIHRRFIAEIDVARAFFVQERNNKGILVLGDPDNLIGNFSDEVYERFKELLQDKEHYLVYPRK